MKTKKIFEILVNKNSEIKASAFEHILLIFHDTMEKIHTNFFWKTEYKYPQFSFEITKFKNNIKFYFIVENNLAEFVKNQIYANYNDIQINETSNFLSKIPESKIEAVSLKTKKHYLYPIKNFIENTKEDFIDPYSSITAALNKVWNDKSLNIFQINFSPLENEKFKKNAKKIFLLENSNYPEFYKKFLLSTYPAILKNIFSIFTFIYRLFVPKQNENNIEEEEEKNLEDLPEQVAKKISRVAFKTDINLIYAWNDKREARRNFKEIFSTLAIFNNPWYNKFTIWKYLKTPEEKKDLKNRICKWNMILDSQELASLVHIPTNQLKTPWINWLMSKTFEPPTNLPLLSENENLTPIWITNFRNQKLKYWILPNDRRRHIYIVWKTWMGKSTMLENMIIDDIKKWRWVWVIDPHWDLAETIIWFIPKNRTNSVIVFDPTDINSPIAFNMLENVKEEHRSVVVSGVISIFKKIFWNSWWPRLEHILRNTLFALIEYPNSTLISIPLMLTSEVYRKKVVNKITDPIIKKFWTHEFAKMSPSQKTEAVWPILNKVWQFLSSSVLRNILGQPKNSFSFRWAMDNKKIIIINLSKWIIWEDASNLLGSMLVTKFQLDAMSRANIPEKDREDFYLYVDEFQNFATDSFATILSEARKYKLNLVMANQYIAQMNEVVSSSVFGNVWTLLSFQVWIDDAKKLVDVFGWEINLEDLINLKKYSIYTKLLINWMPSKIFSSDTFIPHKKREDLFKKRYEKVLAVSREKYCKPKKIVEEKINKTLKEIEAQEKIWEKRKEELKKQKK